MAVRNSIIQVGRHSRRRTSQYVVRNIKAPGQERFSIDGRYAITRKKADCEYPDGTRRQWQRPPVEVLQGGAAGLLSNAVIRFTAFLGVRDVGLTTLSFSSTADRDVDCVDLLELLQPEIDGNEDQIIEALLQLTQYGLDGYSFAIDSLCELNPSDNIDSDDNDLDEDKYIFKHEKVIRWAFANHQPLQKRLLVLARHHTNLLCLLSGEEEIAKPNLPVHSAAEQHKRKNVDTKVEDSGDYQHTDPERRASVNNIRKVISPFLRMAHVEKRIHLHPYCIADADLFWCAYLECWKENFILYVNKDAWSWPEHITKNVEHDPSIAYAEQDFDDLGNPPFVIKRRRWVRKNLIDDMVNEVQCSATNSFKTFHFKGLSIEEGRAVIERLKDLEDIEISYNSQFPDKVSFRQFSPQVFSSDQLVKRVLSKLRSDGVFKINFRTEFSQDEWPELRKALWRLIKQGVLIRSRGSEGLLDPFVVSSDVENTQHLLDKIENTFFFFNDLFGDDDKYEELLFLSIDDLDQDKLIALELARAESVIKKDGVGLIPVSMYPESFQLKLRQALTDAGYQYIAHRALSDHDPWHVSHLAILAGPDRYEQVIEAALIPIKVKYDKTKAQGNPRWALVNYWPISIDEEYSRSVAIDVAQRFIESHPQVMMSEIDGAIILRW